MTRAATRCRRCGAELQARGRLAKSAHAEGLCSDCWLEAPASPLDAAGPVGRGPLPGCGHCPCEEGE